MAIKKQTPAPASDPIRSLGVRDLDDLAPLALNAVTVASEGIVRAAFDAVREHPLTARSYAAARAQGRKGLDLHHGAAGNLARRSAQAHAELLQNRMTSTSAPPF